MIAQTDRKTGRKTGRKPDRQVSLRSMSEKEVASAGCCMVTEFRVPCPCIVLLLRIDTLIT